MSVLSVQALSKNYGSVQALNQVSFDVPQGSVFGILGPNGSGKTTLLGIVMDILKATGGNFLWMGHPGSSNEQRRKIGTLLETPNFYHYLSGQRNLEIAAAIKGRGKEDIPRVLDIVNLTARKDSKFSTYSLGMKQRLAIAGTLLGNPDVLVFDEPTNGLDPAGIAEIRQLMRQLNAQGKTVIMASHILDEVEKVCTHVAIIQKGVLKQVGTVKQLLGGAHNTRFIEINSSDNARLKAVLTGLSGVSGVSEAEGGILVAECAEELETATINQHCFNSGVVLSQLNEKKTSLETRFLEITGNRSDR
jgi:lantibiotic transport system ATP-binding protein